MCSQSICKDFICTNVSSEQFAAAEFVFFILYSQTGSETCVVVQLA